MDTVTGLPPFFGQGGMVVDALWVTALVAALVLVLAVGRPALRRTVFTVAAFFLLALGGLAITDFVERAGHDVLATALRGLFLLVFGMTALRLGWLFLFRLLLPVVRVRAPDILEDVLVIFGYIGWALVLLRLGGLDLGSIVTTSAVITAVIAFSMQETLGNVIGGLALQIDSAVTTGDWIQVGDVVGRVTGVHWRSTFLETRDWETVVVPNSVLVKGQFRILGRRAGEPVQLRRWVWFHVPYEVPPARVIESVEKALRRAVIDGVASEPAPHCIMTEFDASAARYAARYWLTRLESTDPVDSAVRTHVYAALQRAGIPLALPRQRLHLERDGDRERAARHAHEIDERVEWLSRIDLFRACTDSERRTLAEHLTATPFAPGDLISRQGNVAHWLYLFAEGRADVLLEDPDGTRHKLASLGPGEIFGEMGLMTGEPRRASAIATTDVTCYRLDKASFEQILHARPSLAEDLSRVMAARRVALDGLRHELDDHARSQSLAHHQSELLAKIRHFFALHT